MLKNDMLRDKIYEVVKNSVISLQREKIFPGFDIPDFLVEHPEQKNYGDYSTNVALRVAGSVRKSPKEIADLIISKLKDENVFEKVETAGPGFINFFIFKKYLQSQLDVIFKEKEKFGKSKIGNGKKINVEFISANPTGPLTLGNGRGGFCGDVLANVLEKAGYKVAREYYINDIGGQIKKLGHSVIGDEFAVYKGDYIEDLKKRIKEKNPEMAGARAAEIILNEMIKPTVKRMGIKFDKWFSEKSLYQKGQVDKAIKLLKDKNLAYEKEDALWFKSTEFGDDKDRVLIKADGEKTYFASDIAYLKDKIKRGFEIMIFFLGADHYGYVPRLKAIAQALGFEKENIKAIVMQLVRLFKNGKEVKMSKRAGVYVTLDELLDEVGSDVTRFFFLLRNPDSHLNFDLNLAKEQSEKNPVYYIQYAYARIHSILANSKLKAQSSKLQLKTQNLKLLNHSSELGLIKQLIRLPEIVEDIAKDYQVQRLPQYALDLADSFHQFYENCRVISEDKDLTSARLALAVATRIVLENTFKLMGITAPERM